MNRTTIIKGAFLAICLVSLLALPAAAAQNGQGMNAKEQAIDPTLKDDLWTSHTTHRLAAFDMHVQHAKDIIGILNDHNIDTGMMQDTLDTFAGKRGELEAALKNRDREALKSINTELRELARQFFKEMRDAIRERYGATGAAGTAPTRGITGFMGADTGRAAV